MLNPPFTTAGPIVMTVCMARSVTKEQKIIISCHIKSLWLQSGSINIKKPGVLKC